MIYAQFIDRQLLDLSTLDACDESQVQQVVNYMDSVDSQLTGNIATISYTDTVSKYFLEDMFDDDAVIDTNFTDYLLTFFEKTPYYWQRTKTTIRGVDAESQSIVVDVQYKTIDFEKAVMPDSTIVLGEPNYETMLEVRYNKWLNILNTRYNNPADPMLPSITNEFIVHYGNPEDIIAEQRSLRPTATIYNTGNQTTYTGLIDSEAENSHATCTVRYILVPDYVLGVNLGITCKHMYITDYKLENDFTEDLEQFTEEGYATVTDSVYSLIYSYFTCIDESDFDGLYKLSHNFQSMDKYYIDVFTTSYRKHEGFSVSLFDITGTHITCGITISSKERAKGSEITFPSYTDRYYAELELIGDTLKVKNLILLSRKLEGEPAINVDDAETSGFNAKIDLDNEDRLSIEKLICDFSALQLLDDTSSDAFSDVVDISIPSSQLTSLKTAMSSNSGVNKVVWLTNYQQGTSNYASVKCRELFQDETNAIIQADAIYDFILKGGKWYIYNYTVTSAVRLDTTNLNTTGSLCLVTPGKVEAYNSQIKGTVSTDLDNVSDTSVSFDHKAYTPTLKNGDVEQGLVKLTGDQVTEEIFNEVLQSLEEFEYDSYEEYLEGYNEYVAIAEASDDSSLMDFALDYDKTIKDGIAIIYNYNNNRYTAVEIQEVAMEYEAYTETQLDLIHTIESVVSSDDAKVLDVMDSNISTLKFQITRFGGN